MTAYYNEIDEKAAAWLRELIRRGLIALGDVDTRSIIDVRPDDLRGYAQCHFFAGIGVWSYALRRAGWPDNRPVWTGSCPCPPFSAAGKGQECPACGSKHNLCHPRKTGHFICLDCGCDRHADERHLWPHWYWLIGERRPDVVFGEQVASKNGLVWLDLVSADLEGARYAIGALDTCAAGFGSPNIRQRLYWVGERQGWLANAHGAIPELSARQGAGSNQTNDTRPYGQPDGSGEPSELADADNAGPQGRRIGRHGAGQRPAGAGGMVGGVADTDLGAGGQRRALGSGGDHQSDALERPGFGGSGVIVGMADTDGGNARPERQQRSGEQRQQPQDDDTGRLERWDRIAAEWRVGLADAISDGRGASRDGDNPGHDRPEPPHADGGYGGPGPTNGRWADADWLFCRDGKWRPVEPGTFPLAHGAPARVVRLRGYGNAINAAQAQGFIEAYLETKGLVIDGVAGHLRLTELSDLTNDTDIFS